MTSKRTCPAIFNATRFFEPQKTAITNYSTDAGGGSATFTDDTAKVWRRALLGGVAIGALLTLGARSANASVPPVCGSQSTFDPTTGTLTCVQDQSKGIDTQNFPVQHLIVKDLTKDITPVSGTPGIQLIQNGAVTLNSTFGAHTIKTTGDFASGIEVSDTDDSYGGPHGVNIIHSGDIITSGDRANGIDAYSYYGLVSVKSTANIKTGYNTAGITANVEYYGSVEVVSKGNITVGDESSGIEASVEDGSVSIDTVGNISTGNFSSAIDAYVDDGGDVTITSKGNLAIGTASIGIFTGVGFGNISIKSTGDITGKAGSSGIVAVSGYGYYASKIANDDSIAAKSAPRGGNINITSVGDITLTGGNGGKRSFFGSDAAGIVAFGVGSITINSTGDISTSGDGRGGIIAVSYGRLCCGPRKTYAGAGTDIISTGDITTSGDGADAIVGANFAYDISITSTGAIKTSGDGADGIVGASYAGKIEITSVGDVSTSGSYSHGIVARNAYGEIAVNLTGNVSASGENSFGLFIEGDDTNTVTISGGTVSGGVGNAASVAFSGNGDSTLANFGAITGGGSGFAVIGSYGQETINNAGVITGNVDLVDFGGFNNKVGRDDATHAGIAPQINNFNNSNGGTFNSGDTVWLGDGGTLTNDGTINPGGTGKIETTSLWGNLVQSAKGSLGIDIDHKAGTSDRINIVSGDGNVTALSSRLAQSAPPSATLAGRITPNLLTFDTKTFDKSFTILSAEGGVKQNGLTAVDTALIDYSILYPNETDVALAMHVTFSIGGLTPNQSNVLNYFGRGVSDSGDGQLEAAYLALLNAPDVAGIGQVADQLYANSGGALAFGANQSGDALAASLRSCPVAEGPYGQLRETSCVWAKPSYRQFKQDRDGDFASVDSDSSGLAGGFQTALGQDLWGGIGVSFEDNNALVNSSTRADGTWGQIGGVIKWVQGPWKISGSISGGIGDIDTVRSINIPGVNAIATSATDASFVTGLARFAYSFGSSGFYVTPMVDAGFSYVEIDGFTEAGAGSLGLQVDQADDFVIKGGPAVEIGTTISADGLTFRPYLKAGVMFLSEDGFSTTARLNGMSSSVAPFTINSRFDDVFAELNAGVQLFSTDGIHLRFNYEGRFGETSDSHGVDAKLTVNY